MRITIDDVVRGHTAGARRDIVEAEVRIDDVTTRVHAVALDIVATMDRQRLQEGVLVLTRVKENKNGRT